jgi:AcrR family transcriptional regulator
VSESSTHSVPDDAHEAIMEATYRALRSHGYADLTMQDIADEAGKSKSLLHYHYDTKQDLLVAFLEHLLSWFDAKLEEMDAETPAERLSALTDRMLPSEDDEEWERFHRALLELRTQAPYTDAYREQLRRNKGFLQRRFEELIEDGIAAGEFRDVDAEETARFIMSALDGARSSRVTLGDDADQQAVRTGLEEFVYASLRTDDVATDAAADGDDGDGSGPEATE